MSEELVKELNNGNETPKIIEPSEKEPCIDAKPISKRQQCLDETEKRLRSYSGLTRGGLYVAGVVLLVLIILFITVVILASTWPTQPHHRLFPICKDSSCLRAAAQIQESFNSSISPCTNIWEFSCGGWLQKHTLPSDKSSWSSSQQLDFKESVRVRDLITTLPLPLRSRVVERKMKFLYDACMDVDIINTDGGRPLETIISELGGWSILRNWNIDEFDINYLLRTLHIKYGVSSYFKISVQPNPRQPGSSSITISPFGLGLPDRSYYYNNHYGLIQNAYKQFIRDVLINLSVTTTEAKKFGEDMFNYEKRIAEITPHSHTLLNPVQTYNSVKISELKITAASLPLEDILMEMFPESNITEETEVIVTSLEYLTEISRIVTTTDKEIVNSYVMWTLVKKYVPYLSSVFTSTLNNFNSELLGFQKPIQPWEKCAKLIKDVMGFAVESSLELQNPINNSTKNIVKDIFKQILKTAQEKLNNYPVSSELRRYLINKLEGLKLQVGLPDIKNDEHFMKDYYNKLIIIKTDFFASAKNNFMFLRKRDEQLLVSKDFDLKMVSQMIKYPQEVKYLPSLNTIIVPRALLTEDEFENGYPISVMYGKLGIKIANAVISSILPYDSAWNFDLKLLSPFHVTVNESYNSINNQKKCLADILTKEKIISEEIAQLTSLSTLKHVIAVKIAYEALNQHLSDLPHIHQPSLERYEDSAIFFLTFAQEQCSISTELQELFNNYVQYELSQKLLLQVVWSQFSEFSDSFDCKTSVKKCSDMF